MKLSVVIPVYNEAATIDEILARVRMVDIEKEIIVVDDGSTDGTAEKLAGLAEAGDVTVIHLPRNGGKGRALREGFKAARGDIVIVQDADLEYDPTSYAKLIEPIVSGQADVVYGSRFVGGDSHRVLYFWHYVGNRFLTLVSNAFTGINLSDMETCYKVFRREVLEGIDIQEARFGFEAEITAKVARQRWRIYEVGITYHGRTYEEGKKVGWKDGVRALWCIVRYSFFSGRPRRPSEPDPD